MIVFLQELRRRGITLSATDGVLNVQAPKGTMTSELQQSLRAHKEDILEWLRGSMVETSIPVTRCAPDPGARYEPFPLSDMQLGFYMADDPYMEFHVRPHYYVEKNVEALAVERYDAAWQRALARHRGEIVVVRSDGRLETVREPAPLPCRCYDLREQSATAVDASLAQVRREMMRSELPLHSWPWLDLRITLWRDERGVEQGRIHYNHNNFFSDGYGTTRLLQEIDRYYQDPNLVLPPLALGFRDAAVALEQLAQSLAGEKARRYWEERLPHLPEPPDLPLRAGLDRRMRSRMQRREHFIKAAVWGPLKTRARDFGLTPSSALFTAYAEVLSAWSNSRHFVVANMMTRRLDIHPEIREIIGSFASLYPLEIDFRSDESFAWRARHLQEQVSLDARHLQWGGMEVMRALNRRTGDLGRAPIPFVIGSGLFMERFERSDFSCLETSQVMLDHQFWELADGSLYYVWDLIEECFPIGMIDAMWTAYAGLIERLAREPALWDAKTLDVIPATQLAERTGMAPPMTPLSQQCLHEFLSAAAAAHPTQPALLQAGSCLTYAELAAQSTALAGRLCRLGLRRGETVAVVTDRGSAWLLAVYGILQAGATYVPIDPTLPISRQDYLLSDSGARWVLASPVFAAARAWPEVVQVMAVEASRQDAGAIGREGLPATTPTDLAYLIYTSGSTGQPKGVMIEHGSVVNTVNAVNRRFGVRQEDRLFGVSSIGFDLSVYDIFGAAAAGATLVYPNLDESLNPAHWLDLLLTHAVTVWNSAPPLATLLAEAAEYRGVCLPALRLVLLSGDWIPVDLPARLRRLAPQAQIVSLGGATEASIWSIWYPFDTVDPSWVSIPYGYPMPNQSWCILDAWGRAAPIWTRGELYIGGVGLARGYWRDPAKTQASFGCHDETGERLYRTGDMGRYLPGGAIEFLGRLDAQVKIQGHRIELGEIEAVLAAHQAVGAAVVRVQGSDTGKALVAYVTPVVGADLNEAELRQYLAEQLPDYMVPRRIQSVARLPLNNSGKIDRNALPLLIDEPPAMVSVVRRGPQSEMEQHLCALWRTVLQRDDIAATDDFFDLGGQSFEAVRLVGLIREVFGVTLTLGAIWQLRTLEALALRLQRTSAPSESHYCVPIDGQGQGVPLLLVHPAGGNVLCYRDLGCGLARPVWAFQAPGLDGHSAPLDSIAALAQVYLGALPETASPFLLGGWSSGAPIAFEMAAQLQDQGRAAAGVLVIDSPAPLVHGLVDPVLLFRWFLEDLDLPPAVQTALRALDLAALSTAQQLQRATAILREHQVGLGADEAQLGAIYGVFQGIVQGSRAYYPRVINADVLVVRAVTGVVSEFAAHPYADAAAWGWQTLTTGTTIAVTVPGTHYTLLKPPTSARVMAEIDQWAGNLRE